ncbi:MAG: hypothetical protein DYG89_22430 [Caldilinea sp. CFX5]|nr:hypothetical protein [Caldilinea sp. CFX5]
MTEQKSADRQWLWARLAPVWPLLILFLLFLWFYGRFAPQLYFVMDDYIETRYNLSKPLWTVIVDSFSGELNWSGYRPLTYALRAVFSHWLRLDYVIGYYLFGFALHFVNAWLVFHIAKRLLAHTAWAFLAALLFLLLPSHNEALFYMSANANLLGLTFALTTVALALAMQQSERRWRYGWLAGFSYVLAVLAYEVLLPLPLLLWLLEWRLTGKAAGRKQVSFYGALALVAAALLVVRYLAMGERLTHARSDYAVSLDWFHIARGYVILWGQLFLLHSSPWENYPLFQYLRAWLSPFAGRALLAIALMVGCGIGWLWWLRRQRDQQPQSPLYWFEWSVAWLYLLSLPFAMLSGRNPENRYVYIPSVGFAIGLAALLSIGDQATQRRPLLRSGILALPLLLLVFYGYTTASDSVEWTQASRHTESFVTQAQTLLPTLPAGSQLFQTGVPEHVGAAYVFANDGAFQNAMQWLYGDDKLAVTVGGLRLRDYLRTADMDLTKSYLLAYDPATFTTRLPEWVEDCTTEIDCLYYPLAPFTLPANPATTITFAEGLQLQAHKLSWLYRINRATLEPVLVTCWTLTAPPVNDYTFYIHFTDASGATTLTQADHQLRQAYPYAPARVTTRGWPLNTPVCDLTNLTDAFTPSAGGAPAAVRGGVWIPDTGNQLTPLTVTGYEFDQAGRIIFPVTPGMLP